MKKFSLFIFGLFFSIVLSGFVYAEVNAITPSTNDINRVNGWAHVNEVSANADEITLEFVSTRSFWSCFEYRVDDEPNTVPGDNPNPGVLDGRWTQVCVNNSTSVKTIPADEYVDVRMVYGAETDERFDWTRFELPYPRSAEITSPEIDEEVLGMATFSAVLDDKDGDDSVQWAVRMGTCAAGMGTVYGNVDGYHDSFDWDGENFMAMTDTSTWVPGPYCFVFNPTESQGDTKIRLTREFMVVEDTEAPVVTIESPMHEDVLSGIVEVYGTVEDNYLLSHYNVSVYPGDADFRDFSQRLISETTYQSENLSNEMILEWDTTEMDDGEYLIRLAARDAEGNRSYDGDSWLGGDDSEHVIRVVVNNTPDEMDQCKKDGWMTFYNPTFRNQGDCISWLQSSEKAVGNRKDNK